MLSTKSGLAACCRKRRRLAGSARKVPFGQAGPVPPALHTQCAAVSTVRQPMNVALQNPEPVSRAATLDQSEVGRPFTICGSGPGAVAPREAEPSSATRPASAPALAHFMPSLARVPGPPSPTIHPHRPAGLISRVPVARELRRDRDRIHAGIPSESERRARRDAEDLLCTPPCDRASWLRARGSIGVFRLLRLFIRLGWPMRLLAP